MFECTVTGKGSTVWSGTVFDCINEILLLHSRFENSSVYASCNNDAVVGRSLYVKHHQRYTSQLNVTVNFTLIGKNIECVYDNGTDAHVVGSHTLSHNDLTCSNSSDDTGKARMHTLSIQHLMCMQCFSNKIKVKYCTISLLQAMAVVLGTQQWSYAS